MPKLKHRVPSYRRHRRSGQAMVTLDGRDRYLGKYGSEESQRLYERIIAEWLANHRCGRNSDEQNIAVVSVDELILAYLKFCETYYVKNGRPTSSQFSIRSALRPLHKLYGQLPVNEFGARMLKTVRVEMVERDLSRATINKQVGIIKRMFKWAAENEFANADVYHRLRTVGGLRHGRCAARETERVKPVPEAYINDVLPHVAPEISAMIRLQLATGMRPGEVAITRGVDIDMSGRVWVYRPASHKTEHHDKARVIHLGPKAQEVIRPFLRKDVHAFLFSPTDAERERLALRHGNRRTPLSCGNRPGSNRRRNPARPLGDRYTTGSYCRAIQRACDKAFPPPQELAKKKIKCKRGLRWESNAEWKKRLGEDAWQELKEWQRSHRWSPNQLRHNAATNLRKEFGIEAARVVLGHSSAAVTEIYAELDQMKAADIMAKIG